MDKKEDIIWKYVALEGVLQNAGCYEQVLQCMEEYANQQKDNIKKERNQYKKLYEKRGRIMEYWIDKYSLPISVATLDNLKDGRSPLSDVLADNIKDSHNLLQKVLSDNYSTGNSHEIEPTLRDEIETFLESNFVSKTPLKANNTESKPLIIKGEPDYYNFDDGLRLNPAFLNTNKEQPETEDEFMERKRLEHNNKFQEANDKDHLEAYKRMHPEQCEHKYITTQGEDICEKCGADLMDWADKQPKKKEWPVNPEGCQNPDGCSCYEAIGCPSISCDYFE